METHTPRVGRSLSFSIATVTSFIAAPPIPVRVAGRTSRPEPVDRWLIINRTNEIVPATGCGDAVDTAPAVASPEPTVELVLPTDAEETSSPSSPPAEASGEPAADPSESEAAPADDSSGFPGWEAAGVVLVVALLVGALLPAPSTRYGSGRLTSDARRPAHRTAPPPARRCVAAVGSGPGDGGQPGHESPAPRPAARRRRLRRCCAADDGATRTTGNRHQPARSPAV